MVVSINIDKETILWIAGTVIAVITAIGVFVGPIIAQIRQERNRKREEKLKSHFQELKKEAQEIIRVISRVTENYGQIISHSEAIYSEFTAVVLPQPSDNFMAHFPEETTKLGEYSGRIEAHNRDHEGFRLKIMNVFESQGIPVVNGKSQMIPCIYDSIFKPLFNWWKELAANRRPLPDFRNIEQIEMESGYIALHPKGWSASVAAYVRTESDKVEYSRALREVAENKEFKREATTLVSSATQLDNEITTFRIQLLDKLDNVDKLWPGTKKYTFRKEKNCPRCEEIFH